MISRPSLGCSGWPRFVYISNDVNQKKFMTSRHDVITYYGDKKRHPVYTKCKKDFRQKNEILISSYWLLWTR